MKIMFFFLFTYYVTNNIYLSVDMFLGRRENNLYTLMVCRVKGYIIYTLFCPHSFMYRCIDV